MTHMHDTTAELCVIIEQFAFADFNKSEPMFYKFRQNDSGAGTFVDEGAVNRFKQLLARNGLDTSVSTTDKNSLLGHLLMVVDVMLKRSTYYLTFENMAYLLDALAAHPSAREIVNGGRVYYESSSGRSASIVTAMLEHCALDVSNGRDCLQALLALVVLNPTITPDTTLELMHAAYEETALAIVQNSVVDSSIMNTAGETLLCASTVNGHCDAVEALLNLPNCMPNRLSREHVERHDWEGFAIAKVVLHPVLHAAVTLSSLTVRDDVWELLPQLTKRMVRQLLANKESDISRICPHANYKRAVTADSMKQMLAHDSFDIHNIVVKHGPEREDGDVVANDVVEMEVDDNDEVVGV